MRMIDIPPVWLALALAVVWAEGRLAPTGLGFGRVGDLAGGALAGVGLALMLAALATLLRARTTPIPHRDPAALVTGGVFRLSRNPIYLGDAAILLGLCLRWDGVLSLALVPLFVLWIDRRFVQAEEARLNAAFPDAFAAYAARVRRWI